MAKYLLSLIIAAAFFAVTPAKVMANEMMSVEIVDNDFGKVAIIVNGSVLRVTGAEGLVLRVFNVAGGQPVLKAKIDSQDKSYDLNLPKGVYIVQVGNKATRKIVIK